MSDVARLARRTGQVHNFECAKCANPAAAVELIDGEDPIAVGAGPDGEEMAFSLRASAGSVRLTWLGVSLRDATAAVAVLLASAANVDPLDCHGRTGNLVHFAADVASWTTARPAGRNGLCSRTITRGGAKGLVVAVRRATSSRLTTDGLQPEGESQFGTRTNEVRRFLR